MTRHKLFFLLPVIVALSGAVFFRSHSNLPEPDVKGRAATIPSSPAGSGVQKGAAVTELSIRTIFAAPQNRRGPDGGPPLTDAEIEQVRSEIKSSLAAIYGAEKAFYSEYARYSSDFRAIGFVPYTGEALWSKIGFVRGYTPDSPLRHEDGRFLSTQDYLAESTPEGVNKPLQFRASAQGIDLADWARYCRHGCTSEGQSFEVMAVAKLVDGEAPEVWIIDDLKQIRQAQNGLTGADR